MNRAQSVAHWSGVPSLSQLLLAALLRLAAMLVSNAAHPLRMLLSLLSRACHTDVEPDRLPALEDGHHQKEDNPAAADSHSPEAFMLRDREAIVSKHAGGLTGASYMAQQPESHLISPLIPATAGTQGSRRSLFQPEAAAQSQDKPQSLPWIPAPHPERAAGASKGAGTSGAVSGKPRP